EVVVMYLGQVCESGPVDAVFGGSNHPYTEALLSAVPLPDPEAVSARIRLQGTVPSAVSVPSGCPFHTRWPRKLAGVCEPEIPPWRELECGHRIRCHLPLSSEAAARPFRAGGAAPFMTSTDADVALHA